VRVNDGDSKNRVHPLELSTTKARLYIDCVQPEHAGLYTCSASTSIILNEYE